MKWAITSVCSMTERQTLDQLQALITPYASRTQGQFCVRDCDVIQSGYIFALSNPYKTFNGSPIGIPIGQSGEAFAAQAVANVMSIHEDIYENTTAIVSHGHRQCG